MKSHVLHLMWPCLAVAVANTAQSIAVCAFPQQHTMGTNTKLWMELNVLVTRGLVLCSFAHDVYMHNIVDIYVYNTT